MNHQHGELLVHKVQQLISIVALNVFGVSTFYKEQINVLVKLVMINFRDSPSIPAPVIFVTAIGSGKSLVRDIHFVMFHGVILAIVSLFTLGTYQTPKVSAKSIHNSGNVLAVHLDEIHTASNKQRLVDSILALPVNMLKTIMLFSLPQKIVNDKAWMKF